MQLLSCKLFSSIEMLKGYMVRESLGNPGTIGFDMNLIEFDLN